MTFFAILVIIEVSLRAMATNDTIISDLSHIIIFSILVTPPILFFNYKLFQVVKRHRNDGLSPEKKKTFSSKKASSCLIVIACYVVLFVPVFVYVGIMENSRDTTSTFGKANLVGMWAENIASMNSTLNCLIFYWKNKVLRKEGWRVLKSIKIRRGVQS